jgi:hypothetical protein
VSRARQGFEDNRMNRIALRGIAALALGLALTPAWAAGKSGLSQARQDYRQERARCVRGESHQVLATCLQEAEAAYEEARHGRLGNVTAAELARNATQRCEAQPPQDRAACVQRIVGGSATGSVGGGGLIRQTETRTE